MIEKLDVVRLARADCTALRPIAEGQPVELTSGVHVTFHQQAGELVTRVRYEVSAAPSRLNTEDDDRPDTKAFWVINIEMSAHWELKQGAEVTADDARCFAIGQGLMTCHPYARETIQSTSSRMGYPPATINLLPNPWSQGDVELTSSNDKSEQPDT